MSTQGSAARQALGIKETLVSVIISFVMAFVFRGFVIEGFQIPTGSMAPTLLGKHELVRNPDTGSEWAVGPWHYVNRDPRQAPMNEQVGLVVNDPVTAGEVRVSSAPLRAGDRIFVFKYLTGVHEPERWDVCVFKNPATQENYIKRLVGLPGEQVALVDGDVFAREDDGSGLRGEEAWSVDGWRVQRKPERVQRTMFQPVFDSRRVSRSPGPGARPAWIPDRAGAWEGLRDAVAYRYSGAGPTRLDWDAEARPIDDWYPYNQTDERLRPGVPSPMGPYPVSDVALSMGVEPQGPGLVVTPTVNARGREFRGVVGAGAARVEMRGEGEGWTVLDEGRAIELRAGRAAEIEFWHCDQALWLFVDGDLVAGGPERGAYDLSPARRVEAATGRTLSDLLTEPGFGDARLQGGVLGIPELYRRPGVSWSFEGGAFTAHRVTLKRDIHYQVAPSQDPDRRRSSRPARDQPTFGGHPDHFPRLGPDQFFVCGDNSPSSKDARLWTRADGGPDPWVADQIDDSVGTVHRDLMIGRAFVVYFPAPLRAGRIPVPDLGRVRWIW